MTTELTIIESSVEDIVKNNLNIDPRAFTNAILKWCYLFRIKDLTHMKLQKLLYYCYAAFLWRVEKMLFSPHRQQYKRYIDSDTTYEEEHTEETETLPFRNLDFWKYGPISPIIYSHLSHFGNSVIATTFEEYENAKLKKASGDDFDDPIFEEYLLNEDVKEDVDNAIKYTLIALGCKTAIELMQLSHAQQSAWQIFFQHTNADNSEVDIITAILKEFQNLNCLKTEYEKFKSNYIQQ